MSDSEKITDQPGIEPGTFRILVWLLLAIYFFPFPYHLKCL